MYQDMGIGDDTAAFETAAAALREIEGDFGATLVMHQGDISYARSAAYIWDRTSPSTRRSLSRPTQATSARCCLFFAGPLESSARSLLLCPCLTRCAGRWLPSCMDAGWFQLVEPYATRVPYMVGIGNHEVQLSPPPPAPHRPTPPSAPGSGITAPISTSMA